MLHKSRCLPITQKVLGMTLWQKEAEETFSIYVLFTMHLSQDRFQNCHQKLLLFRGTHHFDSSAHDACNILPRARPVQQLTHGLQMRAGKMCLIKASWLHFGTGTFPSLLSTLCSVFFSQRKYGENLCQPAGASSQLLSGHVYSPVRCI